MYTLTHIEQYLKDLFICQGCSVTFHSENPPIKIPVCSHYICRDCLDKNRPPKCSVCKKDAPKSLKVDSERLNQIESKLKDNTVMKDAIFKKEIRIGLISKDFTENFFINAFMKSFKCAQFLVANGIKLEQDNDSMIGQQILVLRIREVYQYSAFYLELIGKLVRDDGTYCFIIADPLNQNLHSNKSFRDKISNKFSMVLVMDSMPLEPNIVLFRNLHCQKALIRRIKDHNLKNPESQHNRKVKIQYIDGEDDDVSFYIDFKDDDSLMEEFAQNIGVKRCIKITRQKTVQVKEKEKALPYYRILFQGSKIPQDNAQSLFSNPPFLTHSKFDTVSQIYNNNHESVNKSDQTALNLLDPLKHGNNSQFSQIQEEIQPVPMSVIQQPNERELGPRGQSKHLFIKGENYQTAAFQYEPEKFSQKKVYRNNQNFSKDNRKHNDQGYGNYQKQQQRATNNISDIELSGNDQNDRSGQGSQARNGKGHGRGQGGNYKKDQYQNYDRYENINQEKYQGNVQKTIQKKEWAIQNIDEFTEVISNQVPKKETERTQTDRYVQKATKTKEWANNNIDEFTEVISNDLPKKQTERTQTGILEEEEEEEKKESGSPRNHRVQNSNEDVQFLGQKDISESKEEEPTSYEQQTTQLEDDESSEILPRKQAFGRGSRQEVGNIPSSSTNNKSYSKKNNRGSGGYGRGN